MLLNTCTIHARRRPPNWHCQLLELSKLAVPCTDLFLRSKLATVATKFIVKLAAAIVTATTRRSVATLAYLADALDRRANWVATLSEPALAVLVNALHRRYARKKRCPTRDARLNIRRALQANTQLYGLVIQAMPSWLVTSLYNSHLNDGVGVGACQSKDPRRWSPVEVRAGTPQGKGPSTLTSEARRHGCGHNTKLHVQPRCQQVAKMSVAQGRAGEKTSAEYRGFWPI